MKNKKITFLFLFLVSSFLLEGEVSLSGYDELHSTHKLIDFNWKSPLVPRIIVKKFPEKIKEISNTKRVRFFIKTMLPLILMENEKIQIEHDFIVSIAKKQKWNESDVKNIYEVAHKYRIIKKDTDLSKISEEEKDNIRYFLDHRIRPVPASIAIGQAAIESGWGTSRFVFEGNNIFGHVANDHKKGMKPKNWKGKERHIKRFDSISEAISAYMLNLNRNRAYRKFRKLRREYPDDLLKMAEGFGNYSIIKHEYTDRLKLIISKYGLQKLSNSTLDNKEKALISKKLKQAYIN